MSADPALESFCQEKALGKGTAVDAVTQGMGVLEGALGAEGMTGLARLLAESCANEIMLAEANAVREAAGTTRNGYRGGSSRRSSARSR